MPTGLGGSPGGVWCLPTTPASRSPALRKTHPNIVARVDGDRTGQVYAAALVRAQSCSAVLRWPDGWTTEDAVGWTTQADEAAVLAALNANLPHAPGNLNAR